jgi:HK97 family phage portal protein
MVRRTIGVERIAGVTLKWRPETVALRTKLTEWLAKALVPVRSYGLLGIIQESFSGAWQRNVECESPQNILAFSALYTSVSMIADDISKLRPKLMRVVNSELTEEVKDPRATLGRVLRKPNRYQTRIQFLSQWIVNKLLQGNTYVLLERDNRRVVTAEYILDSRLVWPLVAEDGSVWYELRNYTLAGIGGPIRVPASEIIHDRMICPWHPLIGITPVYAAGASATQGIRIQANSAKFFENMSRPSGVLTSPGSISGDTVVAMKEQFEKNFSGGNIGRLLVAGDGLKYEPMTIPAADAQLIEQLKWTVEDVARTFKIPPYKLGLAQPTMTNVGALNQEYYSQTLQAHIEAVELLQDEALGLTEAGYEMEMDLEGLLRMDPVSRAERNKVAISAGYLKPDEARASENLPSVEGGDQCYLQQQNFSLSALAKRDAKDDPFATGGSGNGAPPEPSPPAPSPSKEQVIDGRELTNAIIARFLSEEAEAA